MRAPADEESAPGHQPPADQRNQEVIVDAEPPALWSSLPGWGIAADLIPPELIHARRLTVLRRLMAVGVVVLVAVCTGGYYLAAREKTNASNDLAEVAVQSTRLQAVGHTYAGAVSIQSSISQIQSQLAQVMGSDVDLVALLGELRSNLPKTMTITQEAITISIVGAAGATGAATGAGSGGTPAGSGLDTSGLPRIGTVTMTGTGQTLDDLSQYVDRLDAVTGLVEVTPLANTVSTTGKTGTQFSLTLGLTAALLSHRFDVGAVVTK